MCSAVAHAKGDIKERSLRVETYWMKTELQLNVVRGIASELSVKYQRIQHATIAMLTTKLKIATNNVESTIKSHAVGDQELELHRWKYTPMKEKIDRTILPLSSECQHNMFYLALSEVVFRRWTIATPSPTSSS